MAIFFLGTGALLRQSAQLQGIAMVTSDLFGSSAFVGGTLLSLERGYVRVQMGTLR